jgi:enoyl-CoA hydratase/carnithine racemase
MRFLGPRGFFVQGWARAGLIAGTGGVALHQRVSPRSMWRLIATQEKVDAEGAERFGLAEPGVPDARTAAIARAADLDGIPAEVRSAYCELSRSDRWPADDHFVRSARLQAGFIGSERFRNFAAAILGS